MKDDLLIGQIGRIVALAGQVDVDEDGSLLDVGHARMVHEFLQISVCGKGNLNNQRTSLF
jgi:hypothetical protein